MEYSAELPRELEDDVHGSIPMALEAETGSPEEMNPSLARRDVGILVMGLTGSGKSTFISQVTEERVQIGDTLHSCTTEVGGFTFQQINGQSIFLIDTPGFDDTHTANGKLLEKIAAPLCTFYKDGCVQLAGLIYVQRITDPRMAGSSLKSIRIFEKLCGERNFKNVVVLTTMWGLLRSEDAKSSALDREAILQKKPDFFGTMADKGARFMRSRDDYDSALEVIEYLLSNSNEEEVVTDLQREMVDEEKMLADTKVGELLVGDIAVTRQRYQKEIDELEEALEEAREEDDEDLITTISEQRKEYEDRIRQTELDQGTLSVTFAQMTLEPEKWLNRMFEEAHKRDIENNQRIIELERQMASVRRQHAQDLDQLKRANKDQKAMVEAQARAFDEERRLQERLRQEELKDRDPEGSKTTSDNGFFGLVEKAVFGIKKEFATALLRAESIDSVTSQPRRTSKSAPSKEHRSSKSRKGAKDMIRSRSSYNDERQRGSWCSNNTTEDPRMPAPRRAATISTTLPALPNDGTVSIKAAAPYKVVTPSLGTDRRPPSPGPKYPALPRKYG
ncbi:hypothetical protein BDV96DRAFT_584393 [Lophiotrema nucula]|uniref:G domain-containing protein n=1 Tax=Lophiotrema nucula TaxID=690887 RepID=A0A6A5YVE7_9PLEO|nr:hypothetical protein BDV96DRAFT_584393 [Lophiotrema nucula]